MESTTKYKEEILAELESLSADHIKEVLDFVYFIKTKTYIDPSQNYFWTQKWQDMEREAEEDKQNGNIVGDGTVNSLIQELNS